VHDVEGRAGEEPGINAQELQEEAPQRIPDGVDQDQVAIAQASIKPAGDHV
jgi:hypothetical protein